MNIKVVKEIKIKVTGVDPRLSDYNACSEIHMICLNKGLPVPESIKKVVECDSQDYADKELGGCNWFDGELVVDLEKIPPNIKQIRITVEDA